MQRREAASAAARPVREALFDPSSVPAVRCLRRDEELETDDELVEEIYSEEVWEMLQAELKVTTLEQGISVLPVSQLQFHDKDAKAKAEQDIGHYLALDAGGKRDYMKKRMELFVITDPSHPAKKHHAEILQFLDVRTHERGVKAKRDLPAFTLLGEYVGVVRTGAAVDAEAAACPTGLGGLLHDKLKNFSHTEPNGRPIGQWTDHKELVVDPAKAGNMLRFVNDFDGFGDDVVNNVTMVESFDFATLRPHIFFFTVADIRAGEEILLDYGDGYRNHMQSEIMRAKALVATRKELAQAKAASRRKAKKIADLEAKLEADVQAAEKGAKAKSKSAAADKATKSAIKQFKQGLEEVEEQREELQRKLREAKDEASRAETALAEEQAARAAAEEATAQVRRQLEAADEQAATISAAALAVAENDESKVAQIAELEARVAELEASEAGVLRKELGEATRKYKQLEITVARVTQQKGKADDANRNLQNQLKDAQNSLNQYKTQRDNARAEVERLKASSKRDVEKLNQFVDKGNHYKNKCTRMETEMEALKNQLKETQEKSGEEIARLSTVAKGLERDKELLWSQVELLVHRCKELEASHGPGPGSASLAAFPDHALGQGRAPVEQHAQLQLPASQLTGMPSPLPQAAATTAAFAGPQPPPSAAAGSGHAPRSVQDPRRRPPAAAAAAPAAAREERDPILALFRDAAQPPPSAAAAAPVADGSAAALPAHHPSSHRMRQPHGSVAAAAPADADTASDHAPPDSSGHQPGSATAAVMALEQRSSAPSQGICQALDRARSRLAVVGFPVGTSDGMERTRSTADVNPLNDSQRQAEQAHQSSPAAGKEVPVVELPPHLAQADKKENEDGQQKASAKGGGSPEAPAAAANAQIPLTESQIAALSAIMMETLKASGFLPAAQSTPEPQKEQQGAVVHKEPSPPPEEEPAPLKKEPEQPCQQPPSQQPSSERETSSVEDTAKVTGAAPATPGPAEPAAAADSRAEADAAAAVSAAESGADQTSARREGACPEARERNRGAVDRGNRDREGSRRWEDRDGDLTNRRKERDGDRRRTPPRRDVNTRDRYRTEHRSRSRDRGRSRECSRHRVSSKRSRSPERRHRSRDRDLGSDRGHGHARNRDGDHDRHRGRDRRRDPNTDPSQDLHQDDDHDCDHASGRDRHRDRKCDPSHDRHQAHDYDCDREYGRSKPAAAATLPWRPLTRAPDAAPETEECRKRRAPSHWEPQEAHSPTRASSPTTEVAGSKRHRTESPQPESVHNPSASARADERPRRRVFVPVPEWLSGAPSDSPGPAQTATALAAAVAAAAAGEVVPAADADGASSSMSMSPPPLPQGGPNVPPHSPVSTADAGAAAAVDGGRGRRPPSPEPTASLHRSSEGRAGSVSTQRRGCIARQPCIHCKKTSHPSYRCWYQPSKTNQVTLGQRPPVPRRSSPGEQRRAKRGVNWSSGGQAPIADADWPTRDGNFGRASGSGRAAFPPPPHLDTSSRPTGQPRSFNPRQSPPMPMSRNADSGRGLGSGRATFPPPPHVNASSSPIGQHIGQHRSFSPRMPTSHGAGPSRRAGRHRAEDAHGFSDAFFVTGDSPPLPFDSPAPLPSDSPPPLPAPRRGKGF